jgi:hypothetical protein
VNDRASEAHCAPQSAEPCSVCRDEAVAGTVVALRNDNRSAMVSVDGQVTSVAIDLLATVVLGDRLLIHQGFAIAKLERP